MRFSGSVNVSGGAGGCGLVVNAVVFVIEPAKLVFELWREIREHLFEAINVCLRLFVDGHTIVACGGRRIRWLFCGAGSVAGYRLLYWLIRYIKRVAVGCPEIEVLLIELLLFCILPG